MIDKYNGDVLIQMNPDTLELDMVYKNGQPEMTQGFETCLVLAIFGEDCVQNGMTTDTNEKFNSTFPEVTRRKNVSENVKNDGIKAIERALAFMVTERMASSITVTGEIVGVHTIAWYIDVVAPGGNGKQYELNWINGKLTFGYRSGTDNARGGV